MSPLGAARRLAQHDLRDHDDIGGYGFCPLCEAAEGHASDCPWLSMGRIVAALAAAQAIISENLVDVSDHSPCPFCGGEMREDARQNGYDHYDGCDWQALVVALKGVLS